MKKLVLVSNFDQDTVDDVLLADNVMEEFAEALCAAYNQQFATGRTKYWCAVKPHDYKLRRWEP